MSVAPGQIIDSKYRIVRLIGEGGMGTVYEGENSRIGRRVAIKVLHAQVASMPEFVERFEREARAAARIGSPHVCDVLDLGDLPNGDRYIVMEYLDGVSFEDRIAERGRLTAAQVAPIAFELLEGLGTMHSARVIHRDLKPANVFLSKISGGRGEVVKILDFGVAKLLPTAGEVGTMTRTGMMMGTPLYMSPEQARGARDVDGRTDIYAASVMFYRALTGVLPYHAESLNELLFKIVLEDPKPLREIAPEVDEAFAALVHKGLARDVNLRFATAREYQEAIAVWGRAQGRSSLSFAVTVPSEPPPVGLESANLAVAAAASGAAPAASAAPGTPVAVQAVSAAGVTGAAGGTPIAWSEDAPSVPKSRAAATVLTPMGGVEAPPTVKGGRLAQSDAGAAVTSSAPEPPVGAAPGQSGATSASALSGATLASPSGAGPQSGSRASVAEEGAIALAKTGASPNDPASPRRGEASKAGSKRTLVLGGAAAAVLVAVAIVALNRGGSAPTPTGLTAASPPASGSAAEPADPMASARATAPKDTASSSATLAPAASNDPATAGSGAPLGSAAMVNPPAPTGHRLPPSPGPSHKVEPGGAASVAAATSSGTAAAASTAVPATTAATPSAKPAASARKFRTNLD